jgi:subtilase family serine protease
MIFSESLRSPDVDADADVGNEIWFCNGGWGVVGGTSLSCLLWVGFMADVNQIRTTNALLPAGFVNPFLYSKVCGTNGSSLDYSRDFHDIESGNHDGCPAGIGLDAETELGSFIVLHIAKDTRHKFEGVGIP